MPGVVDDTALETSFHFDIETVPTLIRMEDGQETGRAVGWDRAEWRTLTGMEGLGGDLPEFRPGCGAKNVEPGIAEELAVRFGKVPLASRRIESPQLEDDVETCFARGWTDGLPVVPPTEVRVVRMLRGTDRAADEVVGLIPPNQAPCTVEKVAINAVMAGCKPEYMPVVPAAVEAALIDDFCLHGLLATTYFSGPVVVVNGPVTKAIGMNSGVNALGQGNRANATIGRALQLVSGTLMVTLAGTMLFAPELLESLSGTAIVFGSAALVDAVVLAAESIWRRHHPAGSRPLAS